MPIFAKKVAYHNIALLQSAQTNDNATMEATTELKTLLFPPS
jgi:hypothetical protein